MSMGPRVPRQTHTFAELELSPAAYDEISDKLKAAGYEHAFCPADRNDAHPTIDMHGIGITREAEAGGSDVAAVLRDTAGPYTVAPADRDLQIGDVEVAAPGAIVETSDQPDMRYPEGLKAVALKIEAEVPRARLSWTDHNRSLSVAHPTETFAFIVYRARRDDRHQAEYIGNVAYIIERLKEGRPPERGSNCAGAIR